MGWAEWSDLPWPEQRSLLENLAEDPDVPFSFQEGGEDAAIGPTRREAVDAGVDVIDLTAMREQLEADRARQQQGG